jgi:cob(I)alamin adenosyltransferase
MGHRLSKITTKTGDQGTSALASGNRLSKDNAVFDLLGDLDELNAYLGLAKIYLTYEQRQDIERIQHHLMDMSGQVAMPERLLLTDTPLLDLDTWIEQLNGQLPPLKEFIIPGNAIDSSQLHVCRTIARRVERKAVTYANLQDPGLAFIPTILQYLNRLSDYLFVLARAVDLQHQRAEPQWQSGLQESGLQESGLNVSDFEK